LGVAGEVAESEGVIVYGQGRDAGYSADLLFFVENGCAGGGGWAFYLQPVQGAVRAAAIVHLRDGLLARIAAFREAYGPIQYAGFGGEVLRGDVRAETGEAGFYAGGFVGFGTYWLRPGPLQVLPCHPQGFF
jgi:hypothetical protein